MEIQLESSKPKTALKPEKSMPEIDFSKKIEESKAVIQSQVDEKLAKQERKSTRGGARPGAGRKPIIKTADNQSADQSKPVSPAPDVSALLVPPLIAISKIPAAKHEIPELALSPEEAKAAAESINAVLNAFIPDLNSMEPKTAAILGCAMTLGSLGFQKYSIYSDKKSVKPPEPPPKVEPKAPEKTENAPTNAVDYFQTTRVQ